jgi:hypothetical protein
LEFKKVIGYLTADSILVPKGTQGFLDMDSIPMLALVIVVHKDKISIRRARCNEISGLSHLQKLVKYKNLSICCKLKTN